MSIENQERLEDDLAYMIDKKIRIDIAPNDLDPHFLTLFILYWLSSQAVATATRKPTIIELLQAGIRAKFGREDALIKEKLRTYCDVSGVTHEELLEAIKNAIGFQISAVDPSQIKPTSETFNLGEK